MLLLCGFQGALVLGLLAHPLNDIHDVALLRPKGVAENSGPLNVIREPLYRFRQSGERLDTRIPGLFQIRIGERSTT